jgi:hypothetical protein
VAVAGAPAGSVSAEVLRSSRAFRNSFPVLAGGVVRLSERMLR